LLLKNDKKCLVENDKKGRKLPFLTGINGFRLKQQQSSNSPLLIPVEMKLKGSVPTSSNISTTTAVVGKDRVSSALQGNMEVSI
tara:strand:+ start:1111 stop:1362 length:252 start_codon:yes stop_codon:yes gene_type:complete